MIRAVAWYASDHAGVLASPGEGTRYDPTDLPEPATRIKKLGGNTRFLSHLNREAQFAVTAAAMAIDATRWQRESGDSASELRQTANTQNATALQVNAGIELSPTASGQVEVGLLVSGYQGWLDADFRYFQDYLRGGKTSGRGSLFVYTLPTSVAGQVSVCLKLTGPVVHQHHPSQPLATLIDQAHELISEQEASAMLVLLSDSDQAACLAIDTQPLTPHAGEPGIWSQLTRQLSQTSDLQPRNIIQAVDAAWPVEQS